MEYNGILLPRATKYGINFAPVTHDAQDIGSRRQRRYIASALN